VSHHLNPFPHDQDRRELWDIMVRRDIEAFVIGDWDETAKDFHPAEFSAISAGKSANPDSWEIGFSRLADYRDSWLADSATMRRTATHLEDDCFRATTLRDIEISGDVALAHKKFDGLIRLTDGGSFYMNWQTLYQAKKMDGKWWISGFVGYLPHPMPAFSATGRRGKIAPVVSEQHVTAGPYSPVLTISADHFVVISGQAALRLDGSVAGENIAAQTRITLQNCEDQLRSAGVALADVFKVTVYLADLADWAAFNEIYREVMPAPLPVRTAVGVALLPGLLVEVEMWAST